jgi:hypothetical protein
MRKMLLLIVVVAVMACALTAGSASAQPALGGCPPAMFLQFNPGREALLQPHSVLNPDGYICRRDGIANGVLFVFIDNYLPLSE